MIAVGIDTQIPAHLHPPFPTHIDIHAYMLAVYVCTYTYICIYAYMYM